MKRKTLLSFIVLAFLMQSYKGSAQAVNAQDSFALVDFYTQTNGATWISNTNWVTIAPVSTWYGVTVQNARVTRLSLHANNLKGTIPFFLNNLSDLNYLDLSKNQLDSVIPSSLGSLSKLTALRLDSNKLSGRIPAALGNLSNLVELQLQFNSLTDSIPRSISSLSNLQILYLSSNQLIGNIPSSFDSLSNLIQLKADQNRLTGNILFSLSYLNKLTILYLDNNQLTGTIPSSLGFNTSLLELQLNNNQLGGFISDSVIDLPHLTKLTLNNNLFTFYRMEAVATRDSFAIYAPQANIPVTKNNNLLSVSAGGTLSNNTYKWYRNNVLVSTKTGDSTFTIDTAGNYTVAVTNRIASQLTLFGGDITQSIDSLALVDFYNSTNGTGWFNHTNWLTAAPINTWYGVTINSGKVTRLDLQSNRLSGSLPAALGNLSALTYLQLNSNQLAGIIPSTLGNLTNLDTLSMGGNTLSGSIPSSLGNLLNLTFLNIRINNLSGSIPSSLDNLTKLTVLDLKDNSLSGSIPDSLSSKLTNLTALRLQNNQFTFAGMEKIAQKYNFAEYTPQAVIKVNRNGNQLSVFAGGTLSNNTYKWMYNDSLITKTGDSTLLVNNNLKSYSVTVTNAIANQLTLFSYTDTTQAEAIIAMTPVSVTQDISGTAATNINDSTQSRLLTLTPTSGANALNGEVVSGVAIDTAVSTFNGEPYVERHYDIAPSANANTSEATVTLYFTQADFDSFNAYVTANHSDIPLLPANGVDNGNVRIMQLHGKYTTSPDPANYKDSSIIVIIPSVSWDSTNNWWTVTFPVTGFSGFFVSTSNFTLPLTLVEFTGKLQNTAALLKWQTANEVNTKQFLVQHSNKGISFNTIGSIKALSATGNHSYYFTDEKISAGQNFYRLQMTDNDGRSSYSKIISINANNQNPSLTVYPNPARNNAALLFNATAQSKYAIRITDVSGKAIKNINGVSEIGENKVILDLHNFNSGTYFVIFTDPENGVHSLKLNHL
jgi:Leucine-rich repeat (LRR) protein